MASLYRDLARTSFCLSPPERSMPDSSNSFVNTGVFLFGIQLRYLVLQVGKFEDITEFVRYKLVIKHDVIINGKGK